MKYRVIYHQVRVDTFKNSVPLCLPRLLTDRQQHRQVRWKERGFEGKVTVPPPCLALMIRSLGGVN